MIREMGKRLLKGSVNLIDISMPVKIFEPRSYLQKLTDPWVYPGMLDRAASASGPVERLRWTMCYFIAGMQHVFSSWAKPFNPILGETWQGELVDPQGRRCTVALEQVSHHPPVSAWEMRGGGHNPGEPTWRFVGTSNPKVEFSWNRLTTVPTGRRRVEFSDGGVVDVHFPSYAIANLLRGTPQGLLEGEMRFVDAHHALEGVAHFSGIRRAEDGLLARPDAVWGAISSTGLQTEKQRRVWFGARGENHETFVTGRAALFGGGFGKAESFKHGRRSAAAAAGPDGAREGEGLVYAHMAGNWLSHVDFDGCRYWTLQEDDGVSADGTGWRRWRRVDPDDTTVSAAVRGGGPPSGATPAAAPRQTSPARPLTNFDRVLPSDCRFREDLAWLAAENQAGVRPSVRPSFRPSFRPSVRPSHPIPSLPAPQQEKSQEWKGRLEDRQRADKNIRQKGRVAAGLPPKGNH